VTGRILAESRGGVVEVLDETFGDVKISKPQHLH